MYYKEEYPKEFRIQLENEDEIKYLRFLLNSSPKSLFKKFTAKELQDAGETKEWADKFAKNVENVSSDVDEEGAPYGLYHPWNALDNNLGGD